MVSPQQSIPPSPLPITPAAQEPQAEENPRLSRLLSNLLIVLAPLAIFSGGLRGQFLDWDDPVMVTGNPFLHPVTWAHLGHFWVSAYSNFYIPLTDMTYALTAYCEGITPFPFHLASLVFHVLSAVLVFSLLRLYVRQEVACAAGALVFALHPLQVEPVVWIGSLDTVQSAFFSLLALRLYHEYASRAKNASKGAAFWYGLATLSFLLALLSKPSAAVTPLLAALLDFSLHRRAARQVFGPLLPWLCLAAAFAYITRACLPEATLPAPPLWLRPFVAGDALAFYLGKLILPVSLATDYGRTPTFVLSHAWGYWTWLVPVTVAAAAWRVRRGFPALATGLGFFVAALSPVLGFLPFIYQFFSTVADRYAYLAMLGPSLVAAALLARFSTRCALRLAVVPLALLSVLSLRQIPVWHDSISLFTRALTADPRCGILHLNLGNGFLERGDNAAALREYKIGRSLSPQDARIHSNIAVALVRLGHPAEAWQAYAIALKLDPTLKPAQIGMASLTKPGTIAVCPPAATSTSHSASASAPTATSIPTAATPTPTSPGTSPP